MVTRRARARIPGQAHLRISRHGRQACRSGWRRRNRSCARLGRVRTLTRRVVGGHNVEVFRSVRQPRIGIRRCGRCSDLRVGPARRRRTLHVIARRARTACPRQRDLRVPRGGRQAGWRRRDARPSARTLVADVAAARRAEENQSDRETERKNRDHAVGKLHVVRLPPVRHWRSGRGFRIITRQCARYRLRGAKGASKLSKGTERGQGARAAKPAVRRPPRS